MSTNATFTVSHPDGTFSSRYHHWDGQVKGLGVFLRDTVDTPEKVDWLFGLQRGFNSLMHDRPVNEDSPSSVQTSVAGGNVVNTNMTLLWYQQYKKDGLALDWPPLFKKQCSDLYIQLMKPSERFVRNHQTWTQLDDFCDEEYNYIFDNVWKLIVHRAPSFQKSLMVDVRDIVVFKKICQAAVTPQTTPQLLADEWQVSPQKAQNMIQKWQNVSFENRCRIAEFIDFYSPTKAENFVRTFDAWAIKTQLQSNLERVSALAERVSKI